MSRSLLKGLVGPVYYRVKPLPDHPDPVIFSSASDFDPPGDTKQFIVLASTPRSGSNMLGYMLRDHGGFGYPLEYLSYVDAPYWAKRFGTADMPTLMRHFMKHRTSPNGNFVIKAHWHQFEEFADKVETLSDGLGIAKFLWIYRSNLLNQAVSWAIADQTNAWISGVTARMDAEYDFDSVVKFARYVDAENRNWQKYLTANYPDSSLAVDYVDIVNPKSDAAERIQNFLGVDIELRPSRKTEKQSNSTNKRWKDQFRKDSGPAEQWILEPRKWSL
jgi:LPS sulfotransferase NodH